MRKTHRFLLVFYQMEPILTHFLGEIPADSEKNPPENPHSCDAWNALGYRYYADKQYKQALQAFSDAVHLSDQYHHYIHYECSATHFLLAKVLMHKENWSEAKAELEAAIFQDHGNVPALAARVWIAERIDNNPQDSAKFTQQLRRFQPGYIVPTRWRDIADYDGALADDSAWNAAIKYKDYQLVVRSETARDVARKLTAENPRESTKLLSQLLDNPRAWRHYGEALMKAELPEAHEVLEKAKEEHAKWHAAYHRAAATHRFNRALAYEALGEVLLAWQECAKAADIDKHWQVAKDNAERLGKLACA